MMTRRKILAAGAASALHGTAQINAALTNAALTNAALADTETSAKAPPKGWYVPIEDADHTCTFMQWPVDPEAYDSAAHLAQSQETIATIANMIADFEPVRMLMGKAHKSNARPQLSEAVEIWDIPTDDLWCRDSGPVFMVDGQGGLAISHLNFNGWGRYRLPNDMQVSRRVAEILDIPFFDSGIVGEGGGVEQDGDGTLLAHESSWINTNRNSGRKAEIEARLLAAYGAEKVIWASGLMGQDVTDYHIDSLARFIKPGHVAIQLGDAIDSGDVWSTANFETYEVLRNARDARGRRLKIDILPEPRIEDWVSTYANYYVCNGAVLMSLAGDPNTDEDAKAILKTLYPDRAVLTLETDVLGRAGGGIHCATQQMPAT